MQQSNIINKHRKLLKAFSDAYNNNVMLYVKDSKVVW